jgi:hypothetical protein
MRKDKPKGMSEEAYRKMANKTTVTIKGVEYTIQSVSTSWLLRLMDKCGITGGKSKDTEKYWHEIFTNCVVSPPEVQSKGLRYFDENEDGGAAFDLYREIESFLTE